MRATYAPPHASPHKEAAPHRYELPAHRWVDFLLLGFMLSMLAVSLDAAGWSPGLERLLIITLLAVIAATPVAISDFSALFALFYSIITGAAAILYGLSPLAAGAANHQEAVYQIVQRAIVWLRDVSAGSPAADALIFVLLLSILLWILTFNAVWVYFREGRKWQAVLPAGLAMLVNLYYAPVNLKAYFILYLIASMLLVVRATLAEREKQWRQARVYFPLDIGFDVMRDAVIFILVVVMASWVAPSAFMDDEQAMINPLATPWNQVKDAWTQLFDRLNYGESAGAASPSVAFAPSHPLEGPRNISDAPVMDVKTAINRYYQATILDTYVSTAWELRNTVNIDLDAASPPTPNFSARRIITQTVTMRQMTNILMGAPMPVAVSPPASARVIPQGLTPAEALTAERIGVSELAMILSDAIIQPGETYTITSAVSFATESQLRSDSQVYPPDIRARYLQLPDTVPQRVFDLAEEVAQGYDTPYDIAKAVETFVRGYEYSDQIPGPKPGQDAADYFLFEEKKGYCDYYATAMAVMLRHLGIPARLAQGYATGDYDPLSGGYRLTEKDAHTWVEVYFPTYGWIPFEPTASEPVLQRLSQSVVPPKAEGRASILEQLKEAQEKERLPDETAPSDRTPGVRVKQSLTEQIMAHIGFLFLALALIGLGLALYAMRRWLAMPAAPPKTPMRRAPRDAIDKLWARMLHWGRLLGVPQRPSLTPMEQAELLAQALPQISDEALQLAQYFAQAKYAPHPLTLEELTYAQFLWLRMRGQLLRAWLNQRFHFRHRLAFWR